jgi:hypothetical protein
MYLVTESEAMKNISQINFTVDPILNQNYTDTQMQMANDAYAIIALVNVLALIIKHFVYFYVIVGGERPLSILWLVFTKLDSNNAFTIAALLTSIHDFFTWPIASGLAASVLLNCFSAIWVFIWYEPLEKMHEPSLSAHY